MGLRDLLQAMAPVFWAAALVLVVSRKRLVRGLTRAGAVDAASAQPVSSRSLTVGIRLAAALLLFAAYKAWR